MAEEREYVILEPNGRVIIPELVMERYVMYTVGCALWYNKVDQALGIRLLRNVDDPPYRIERRPGESGGETGVLDTGGFLAKAGFQPGPEPVECPVKYFRNYHMLGVMMGELKEPPRHEAKGFLDDFPALDD